MPSRISRLFEKLRVEGRPGLIAYITAGDPSPDRTADLVLALERGGVDLIELGVPFSDPIADGPVIQRGSERALSAGTTLKSVLGIVNQIRSRSEIPVILFSYLNPLLRYGFERLADDAAARGFDGCLLTDLSVEEAEKHVSVLRSRGLDTIFMVAPTSTPERLRLVARYSSGFVYLVSRTGVTGERESVASSLQPLVRATRAATKLPLAVGFGISKPEQVAEVGSLADAVVVGSAFVRTVAQNLNHTSLEDRLETLARELRGGFLLKAGR